MIFKKNNLFGSISRLANNYISTQTFHSRNFSSIKNVSSSQETPIPKIEEYKDRKFIESLNIRESISQMDIMSKPSHLSKNSLANSDHNIVYINGIPNHWSETQLLKYFDKYQEKISKIKFIKNALGKPTRNGLIFLKDEQTAEEFVSRYENDWINTKDEQWHLRCSIFGLKRESNKLNIINRTRQVMIYNLAYETTEVDIMNIVKEYGEIEQIQLPMNSKSKNKGYCLVTFPKEKNASDFVDSCSDMTLHGRNIKFKQKHFPINSQYPKPSDNSLTKVIKNAETKEIFIGGALEKFGMEYFGTEEMNYSMMDRVVDPKLLAGPSQYYYIKKNKNFKEMRKGLKAKYIKIAQKSGVKNSANIDGVLVNTLHNKWNYPNRKK